MQLSLYRLVLALGFCAALTQPARAAFITSNFNTGLQGWTGVGGAVSWQSTGGNPGGFLQEIDTDALVPFSGMYVQAPAAFLGNLSAFIGSTISFDAKNISNTTTNWANFGQVTIISGATSITADLAGTGQPTANWTTYSSTLNAASFGTTAATFASVMGNVTGIQVNLESNFGVAETTGFDNFTVGTVTAAPAPPSLVLFGIGGVLVLGCCWLRRPRAATQPA